MLHKNFYCIGNRSAGDVQMMTSTFLPGRGGLVRQKIQDTKTSSIMDIIVTLSIRLG